MGHQKSGTTAANIVLVLAVLILLAAIGTAVGQDMIIKRYIGLPFSAFAIFMIANPVAKVVMLLAFVIGAFSSLIAIIALATGRKAQPKSPFTALELISLCSAIALIALGGLCSAYTEANLRFAAQAVGEISFEVIAPYRVEQLFTLGTTLWPAAFILLMIAASMRLRLKAKAI